MNNGAFWDHKVPKSANEGLSAKTTNRAWDYYQRSKLSNDGYSKLILQLQADIQALENSNLGLENEIEVLHNNHELLHLNEKPYDELLEYYKELRNKAFEKELKNRKLQANEYRKILGQQPNLAFYANYVLCELSDIYKLTNTSEVVYKSIAILEKASVQYPNVLEFQQKLALQYSELGNYDKVSKVYTKLIKLFESGADIYTINSSNFELELIDKHLDEVFYRTSYEQALYRGACYSYLCGNYKHCLENIAKLEEQKSDPEIGYQCLDSACYEPTKIKSLFQLKNYNEILNILKDKIEKITFIQSEDHDYFIFGSDRDEEEFWHADLINNFKSRINLLTDELYFKILLKNNEKQNNEFFDSILSQVILLERSSIKRFDRHQEINYTKLKLAFCALQIGNFVNAFEIYTQIDPQIKMYPDFMSSSSKKMDYDSDERSTSIALLIASDNGFDLSQILELGKACSLLELGELNKAMANINQVIEYLEQNPEKIFNHNFTRVDNRDFKQIVLFRELKSRFIDLQRLRIQNLTDSSSLSKEVVTDKYRDFIGWVKDNFLDLTKKEYTDF